jgi:DNA (cytosine-5)-methyltransferase 1
VTAFYNEHDPFKAQWLRNLIAAGVIAPGVVDERSIEDIAPNELYGYKQVHLFAGIGVWSYALRLAGWPDDRQVWTISCPCQPFSTAGALAGFEDERHLWPAAQHLLAQCRPATVIGEQVASEDAKHWIDLVSADMEIMGYAFGAVAFPAASVGAPENRLRTYWMGHTTSARSQVGEVVARIRPAAIAGIAREVATGGSATVLRLADTDRTSAGSAVQTGRILDLGRSAPSRLADTDRVRLQPPPLAARRTGNQQQDVEPRGGPGELGNADGGRRIEGQQETKSGLPYPASASVRTDPLNGFWRGADWLFCRDGCWRAVEPGTFPLADGPASRVGRLHAYGDAIVAPQAKVFIESVMECIK